MNKEIKTISTLNLFIHKEMCNLLYMNVQK